MALESLELAVEEISFQTGTRLPGSITRLVLEDGSSEMPPQFVQLPRLAHLELLYCGYSANSMGQLSRLAGSLTRLETNHAAVPPTLPALTRLQHLSQFSGRVMSLASHPNCWQSTKLGLPKRL
jgi:hypothetical protein